MLFVFIPYHSPTCKQVRCQVHRSQVSLSSQWGHRLLHHAHPHQCLYQSRPGLRDCCIQRPISGQEPTQYTGYLKLYDMTLWYSSVTPITLPHLCNPSPLTCRYIESLTPENQTVGDWQKSMTATRENTPLPPQGKLPVHWLKEGSGHHENAANALWALRDLMMKDAVTVSRTLDFSQLWWDAAFLSIYCKLLFEHSE